MTALFNWLDDRTGYKGFVQAALYEHIPGGARWRYVWGSTLMFAFMTQMVTGLLLWMHYSPSSQTAWESVYYIQHEMSGGWLLRGIHHYTAQIMIILLALHMLQVIVDGAYRAPREINFWIGLVLLNLVLAISLTGYLLPWDQRGYWSTSVATSLMGVVPGVGPVLQRLVIGGPTYGHHTLTRFFAVHAGLLPFLMMVFIAIHVYVFRRHGLRYKEPKRGPDAYFWADQVLKDAVACLGVLLVVLLLCVKFGLAGGVLENPGRLGAPLSAPADPSEPFGAARPEWYFLFLFQFLKLPAFAGHGEVYGAVVIPGVIMFLLFLMPLVGRWKVGHWFNVLLITFLSTGIVLLTGMALVEDAGRPHFAIPLLGRLGLKFSIVWITLLMVLVLSLIPMIGRERNFRTNLYVLAALVFGVMVAVAVVVAGGGTADASPAATMPVISGATDSLPSLTEERVHQYLLLAMLGGLVLLITMVLLKSPVRVRGRLAGDRVVTGAADAEVAGAAAANTSGPDDVAPQDEVNEGSWIRRWELHHRARLALLFIVLGGTVLLTAVSLVGGSSTDQKRADYRASVKAAERDAQRVFALAGGPVGIPPQGAVWLLRNDPMTQGPRLFARHCASCHRYDGHNGLGAPEEDPQSAPDLKGFASREWITGLLDPNRVDAVQYFGPNMKAHTGKMVDYVKDTVKENLSDEQDRADLHKIVTALAAEAQLPAEHDANARDAVIISQGREAMSADAFDCTSCHNFHDRKASLGGANRGPDLSGYGSREWLIDFVRNPAHPRFYGSRNDRMPHFGEQKVLDDRQISLIVDWLRGDETGGTSPTPAPAATLPASTPPATAPAAELPAPATTVPAATAPASTAPATTVPAATAPAATAPPATAPAPEPVKEPAGKRPDPKELQSEFEEPAPK